MLDLPEWVREVFSRYLTCELSLVGDGESPIAFPMFPLYLKEEDRLIFATSIATSRKAERIEKNPKVSVLYWNPIGSSLEPAPIILIQGKAALHRGFLHDNPKLMAAYLSTAIKKMPNTESTLNSPLKRRLIDWYLVRLVIEITPHKIHAWRGGDLASEPEIFEVGA